MLLFMELALALSLQGPYDADPQHAWNELHRALFTWCPAEPDEQPPVEPDPLFWPLPTKPWSKWTVSKDLGAAIDRFDASLVKDPLKRAILQHDLWMFLDGLEGLPMANTRSYSMDNEAQSADLRRRLVPMLRRLALTPDELKALPDNYAQAAKSKTFQAAFDPSNPERPFLPPDLLEPEGPWVLLGRPDEKVLAEEHVKLMRGRSVFLVFIALPDGRAATLQYVEGLKNVREVKKVPNPPAGTRVALLRRALLLDSKGIPQLSPLTEEIGFRASLAEPRPGPAENFEFHLSRGDLFRGAAGGLHATGSETRAVRPFFNLIATAKVAVRSSCTTCHGSGAILATGFRFAKFGPGRGERLFDGVPLRVSTVERETELTVKRQRADRSWEMLSKSWPKD